MIKRNDEYFCDYPHYYPVEETLECPPVECLSFGELPEFPILSWCSSTSIHNSTSQCSDLDFELGECHQEAELSKNLFGGRARAAVAVESSFQGQPWCTGLVGGRVCLPFCFCTMILAVVLFAI